MLRQSTKENGIGKKQTLCYAKSLYNHSCSLRKFGSIIIEIKQAACGP